MDIPISGPVMLDGAAGTALIAQGAPAEGCLEQWALEHPDAVIQLQRSYVEAGSQVLLTPTFGANAVRLAAHGRGEQVERYNRALAALTREAAAGRAVQSVIAFPGQSWYDKHGAAQRPPPALSLFSRGSGGRRDGGERFDGGGPGAGPAAGKGITDDD